VIPPIPADRSVFLVPLGDFQVARLSDLAGFYANRYGITVGVLGALEVPAAADPNRGQLVGERLIAGMRGALPEANDRRAVVIGVTSGDLYLSSRPDWAWAFGLRQESRLGVISTARMSSFALLATGDEASRLRKMVTKYIGLLYFGLNESDDPGSAVYRAVNGPGDLDRMGDEF
jgi:hypothetical protein